MDFGGYRGQQDTARKTARQGDPALGMVLEYDEETEEGTAALLADYVVAPSGTFIRTEDGWRVNAIVDGDESNGAADGDAFDQQIYAGFIGEPGDADELTNLMRRLNGAHSVYGYPAAVDWMADKTSNEMNRRITESPLSRGGRSAYGAFALLAGQNEDGGYELHELDPAGNSYQFSARIAGAPDEDESSRGNLLTMRNMDEQLAERYEDVADTIGVEDGVKLAGDLFEEYMDEWNPSALSITHLSDHGVKTKTLDQWLDEFER